MTDAPAAIPPLDVAWDPAKVAWQIRQRIVIGWLVFCAVVVGYSLRWEPSPEVAKTAIETSFWSGTGVVFAYVFGRVVEFIKGPK